LEPCAACQVGQVTAKSCRAGHHPGSAASSLCPPLGTARSGSTGAEPWVSDSLSLLWPVRLGRGRPAKSREKGAAPPKRGRIDGGAAIIGRRTGGVRPGVGKATSEHSCPRFHMTNVSENISVTVFSRSRSPETPPTEGKVFLLAMIDAVRVQRQRLEALRDYVKVLDVQAELIV